MDRGFDPAECHYPRKCNIISARALSIQWTNVYIELILARIDADIHLVLIFNLIHNKLTPPCEYGLEARLTI